MRQYERKETDRGTMVSHEIGRGTYIGALKRPGEAWEAFGEYGRYEMQGKGFATEEAALMHAEKWLQWHLDTGLLALADLRSSRQ